MAGPVRVMGAGGGQAVGHIGQAQIGVTPQVLVQSVCLSGEGLGAARRISHSASGAGWSVVPPVLW